MAYNLNLNLADMGATLVTGSQTGITGDQGMPFIIGFKGDPEVVATTTVSGTSVTFLLDAVADSTVGVAGVIDWSNASYDTIGEFVNAVNASTTGWFARVCAGFTGNTLYSGGSTNIVATALNAVAYPTGGVMRGPVWDTSKIEDVIYCIGPEAIGAWNAAARISARTVPPVERVSSQENFFGLWNGTAFQNILQSFTGVIGDAEGGATALLKVYSAKQTDTVSTALQINIPDNAFVNDTARTLTGADGGWLAVSRPGERLVVFFDGTATTLDAMTTSVTGAVCSRATVSAQSI